MTPRLEVLDALIDAVERGTYDPPAGTHVYRFNAFMTAVEDAFGLYYKPSGKMWDAYRGSTDAALDLLAEVMPDWYGCVDNAGEAYVCPHPLASDVYKAEANTPARAILLAILKALRAQEAE